MMQKNLLRLLNQFMATMTGVFTGIRGGLGSVVFSVLKGSQILRTRKKRCSIKSSLLKQFNTLFSQLVLIFKPVFKSHLSDFWQSRFVGKSCGFGGLIGLNMNIFTSAVLDYNLLQITKGSLPVSHCSFFGYVAESGECVFRIDPLIPSGGSGSDRVFLFVYNIITHQWVFDNEALLRSHLLYFVYTASGLNYNDLVGFIFFASYDSAGNLISVSNSQSSVLEDSGPIG